MMCAGLKLRTGSGRTKRHNSASRLGNLEGGVAGDFANEKGPELVAPAQVLQVRLSDYAVRCASDLSPLIAACAAARRAMGTR
jgi:hypothetical protein